MITDKNNRFSGETAQTLNGTTTGGAFSTNVIDISSGEFFVGDGRSIYVQLTFPAAVTSGTATTTMDVQLWSIPTSTAAVSNTFASTITNGSASIAATAHGLANGTRITLGTAVTPFVTTAPYFVVNATENAFELAATPAGAPIAATASGTPTLTWYGDVIACSGAVAIGRMVANSKFAIKVNPAFEFTPLNRYLAVRYVPGAALTGGTVLADMVINTTDGTKFYPIGSTIK